jgi:hypothetical protein
VSQLALIDTDALPPEEVAGRDPYDRYFTPPWATRVLLDYLGARLSGRIWEPTAGHGHIVRELREAGHDVHATDILPHPDLDAVGDCLGISPRCQWVVCNPPYSTRFATAADVVKKALDVAEVGVAALVRLSWLEPCADRVRLLEQMTDLIVCERVQFINAPPGNNMTSAWVVWDRRRAVGSGHYVRFAIGRKG